MRKTLSDVNPNAISLQYAVEILVHTIQKLIKTAKKLQTALQYIIQMHRKPHLTFDPSKLNKTTQFSLITIDYNIEVVQSVKILRVLINKNIVPYLQV